jgi:hypothetical protein
VISDWLPLLSLIGGAAGGAVLARRPRVPSVVDRPVCPCGHVISTHEGPASNGPCREQVRRQHYDSLGDRNGWEWVPCACLRYCGPELLSAYQVRGIATTDVPAEVEEEKRS